MTVTPLVRKILLGAAESTLDIAGAAVLPGAWPILRGALEPVLERLKQRLGGQDITSSAAMAAKAADAFEADRHLQEILRSALIEQLDSIAQSQHEIDGDVQKLMVIVTGDQKLLEDILGGVDRIEQHLEAGVNLSPRAISDLSAAIARQADNSRDIRAIALRATGPVADLLERQVQRLQLRAIDLVDEGAADRAEDELQEGLLLVGTLLNEAPSDPTVRLQLGFIYKTCAQVATALGRSDQADDYTEQAEAIFAYIRDDVAGDATTAWQIATAIHGLGNTEQLRGRLTTAIAHYKESLAIFADNPYALHDIFSAYAELARQGEPHFPEMRQTLEALQALGPVGTPGFSAEYVAGLAETLNNLESNT